ncbi:MAG: gamma-glutamyltransferase, partial [Rhodoferax sp.]|nr:gamma-glutamyltransferase [Rhodoferax sp.]
MLHALTCRGGLVTAPHHLAAQAGAAVLRDGGNAVEAMVAAAATIAVVYPHMNAIGGDGFWLIREPGADPVAIAACGPAAQLASRNFYQGLPSIPERGPLAALTVAGTIDGWRTALDLASTWGRPLPLPRLMADAVRHARDGFAVTTGQRGLVRGKFEELARLPGFADTYLDGSRVLEAGERLRLPRLATTLETLGQRGLRDFYEGELAAPIGAELERIGSPLRADDLAAYRAAVVTPLVLQMRAARVFNLPPPTQGLATLMILGQFERLGIATAEGFEHVHGLVEATKHAFRARDRVVTDPGRLPGDPQALLAPGHLDALARQIDLGRAQPWPDPAAQGDTVWMGAIDREGRAVSFIQSVY